MYIVSLVLTTILSLANASFLILDLSGATNTVITNLLNYLFAFLTPTIFFFLVATFAVHKKDRETKALSLALSFTAAQFIICRLLETPAIAGESSLLKTIIELTIIALTFILSIIFSIKSTGTKNPLSDLSAEKISLVVFIYGMLRLAACLVSAVIFQTGANSVSNAVLSVITSLNALNTAIFALAAYVTLSPKPTKKDLIFSWIGAACSFFSLAIFYLIALI